MSCPSQSNGYLMILINILWFVVFNFTNEMELSASLGKYGQSYKTKTDLKLSYFTYALGDLKLVD